MVSKTIGCGFKSYLACQRRLPSSNPDMNKASRYISEVMLELKKATWPWDPKEKGFARYKELSDATVVVFITMILLAGFSGIADYVLAMFFQAFTH